MKNVLCYLLGHKACEPTAGVELCERCGDAADYYGDGSQWTDGERYGLVDPLRRLYWRLRQWTMPRCPKCGKSLLFKKKYNDFCSNKCFSEWIPF